MEELEGVGSYLGRCSARREADGDELSAARWGRRRWCSAAMALRRAGLGREASARREEPVQVLSLSGKRPDVGAWR